MNNSLTAAMMTMLTTALLRFDWNNVPKDIGTLIGVYLSMADRCRSRRVCKSWMVAFSPAHLPIYSARKLKLEPLAMPPGTYANANYSLREKFFYWFGWPQKIFRYDAGDKSIRTIAEFRFILPPPELYKVGVLSESGGDPFPTGGNPIGPLSIVQAPPRDLSQPYQIIPLSTNYQVLRLDDTLTLIQHLHEYPPPPVVPADQIRYRLPVPLKHFSQHIYRNRIVIYDTEAGEYVVNTIGNERGEQRSLTPVLSISLEEHHRVITSNSFCSWACKEWLAFKYIASQPHRWRYVNILTLQIIDGPLVPPSNPPHVNCYASLTADGMHIVGSLTRETELSRPLQLEIDLIRMQSGKCIRHWSLELPPAISEYHRGLEFTVHEDTLMIDSHFNSMKWLCTAKE